ncbi:dienelactone hydrolase family protein [Undibacterium sp.]|uniref:dienelactone hydrolase family protein n=1 Tax=Undibacterium sp. TaxID=1914977 RepID=UPI0025F0FA12|nr:dienelactone hydrolase family protein [Undibacterium sp.]
MPNTHAQGFAPPQLRCLSGLLLLSALSGCGGMQEPELSVSKITYTSLDAVKPLSVPAELRMPRGHKLPAVVIVHGSSGIDSRGISYAKELNAAGIATLEIDMWAARGISDAAGRPKSVPETLPDAYGALKYLAALSQIDSRRIGIMGFSWGGVVTMLSATTPYTEQYMAGTGLAFAAHAPNYPVCWVYNRVPGYAFKSFTGAKVFLQGGALDTYDLPDTCPKLALALAAAPPELLSVKMYANATHGFDRSEASITISDPFAHLGKGGEVLMAPNPEAASLARTATVTFFLTQFGM